MLSLVISEKNCYGCKMCQLACSFHKTGTFSLAHSCLNINRSDEETRITLTLEDSCDFCENEMGPLCVKYCLYGALKVEKEDNGQG